MHMSHSSNYGILLAVRVSVTMCLLGVWGSNKAWLSICSLIPVDWFVFVAMEAMNCG